jgi:hypothetical protein
MRWVREVDFNDQEIDDLYIFLRTHHGIDRVADRTDTPRAVR